MNYYDISMKDKYKILYYTNFLIVELKQMNIYVY